MIRNFFRRMFNIESPEMKKANDRIQDIGREVKAHRMISLYIQKHQKAPRPSCKVNGKVIKPNLPHQSVDFSEGFVWDSKAAIVSGKIGNGQIKLKFSWMNIEDFHK